MWMLSLIIILIAIGVALYHIVVSVLSFTALLLFTLLLFGSSVFGSGTMFIVMLLLITEIINRWRKTR